MLPSWIAEPARARPGRGRRAGAFVERTLGQGARLVEQVVFSERAARRPGYLQSLDARVKLLSVLALLVTATFLHHIPSLWLIGAFAAAAVAVSRVEAGLLLNRVWWVAPGVFVIAAVPAVLNVVTPGEAVVTIYRVGEGARLGPIGLPGEVTVTRQGLAAAGLVVTRLFVGVLLAVSLTLTTRWQDLLRAAHTRATAVFVFVLGMAYRYAFVLMRTVEQMHLAKRARTMSAGSLVGEHRWIGGRIGHLFARSRQLTERVYAAMVARGYRGEPKALREARFGGGEAWWLVSCAAVIGLALVGDRVLLKGVLW